MPFARGYYRPVSLSEGALSRGEVFWRVFAHMEELLGLNSGKRRRGRRGGGRLTDADTIGPCDEASGHYLCLCAVPDGKVVFLNSASVERGLGEEQRRLLGLLL